MNDALRPQPQFLKTLALPAKSELGVAAIDFELVDYVGGIPRAR